MRKKTTPKTKTEKKGPSASYSQFASTTQSGSRRMLFVGAISDQRKEVTSGTRIAMVAKSRWAVRNSPIYKQCVDEAVLVSVGDGLVVQSNARDPKVAVEHQNYFRDWAVRCDLTNRYNLGQIQAMWMSGALVDGDSFGILTNDPKTGVPKLQILESHRVGSPAAKFDPNNVDGAYLGTYGEILGWNVYTDGETRDRYVPSQSMLQVMEFERPSAVRGYPVLQSSLLSVQDQLEIYELEKAACRAASDHVMLLKKQGGVLQDDPASKFSGDYNSCEKMASQMGGKVLVVDQNEDFSQVQNNRPSPAWIGMMTAIERDIVRLLPYEYQVDPSKIGGASVRLVASKVSRWAAKWQSILIDNLDRVYDYVIADAIAKGKLPDDPDFNRKSWITPRDITVDAGREASQDRADLQMGLTTAQAILGKKGMTYDEVLEQRAVEMEKLVQKSKERNLPLWMLYQSAFNWLQQGQASSQTPDAVADNLDLPPPPEPSNP
jgi:capsid protein